ncbi:uncharacterized protein C2845_PM15G13590 [Panicum miliaceum]|uniref:Uncharacterized protein n=1 Tax=Panicum miliaceum TaxID=4540 RepID=A0A3L6Q6C0_PANMI|nr:uncharacterized protein C2845_PM15G13590 [Panicum miliaceum]
MNYSENMTDPKGNRQLQHAALMATTGSKCFLTLGLAYIIVHLLQPSQIPLITATDGDGNLQPSLNFAYTPSQRLYNYDHHKAFTSHTTHLTNTSEALHRSKVSSSGWTYIPWNKVRAQVPQGIQVPMCFCDSLCNVMESKVLGDDFGMRFFMCENYEYNPPKRRGKDRPKSQQDKDWVEREARWARETWQRMLHEEQKEEKQKKDQEDIWRRFEEVERQEAQEREADRERKRERACRVKEAGPEAIAKGRYPRCT